MFALNFSFLEEESAEIFVALKFGSVNTYAYSL